jgi:hypothetical protein
MAEISYIRLLSSFCLKTLSESSILGNYRIKETSGDSTKGMCLQANQGC